jgi:hypothetical protein
LFSICNPVDPDIQFRYNLAPRPVLWKFVWYGLMIIGMLVLFFIFPLHETVSLEPVEQLSIQILVLTCLLLGIHCSGMYLTWSCGNVAHAAVHTRHGNCHCVKIWSHCIHFLLLTNLNILSLSLSLPPPSVSIPLPSCPSLSPSLSPLHVGST